MTDPLGPRPPIPNVHLPPNVLFGNGIEEALPYSEMVQAPYPPMLEPSADNIAAMIKSTNKELTRAPPLLAFIVSQQQGMSGVLSEAVIHTTSSILQNYIEEGIPFHTGHPW